MICLDPNTLKKIEGHALASAPHESCGVAGMRDGYIFDYVPCENIFEGSHGFCIAKSEFETCRETILAGGGEVILVHSHPNDFAEPSPADISGAQRFCVSWILITSLYERPRPLSRLYNVSRFPPFRVEWREEKVLLEKK